MYRQHWTQLHYRFDDGLPGPGIVVVVQNWPEDSQRLGNREVLEVDRTETDDVLESKRVNSHMATPVDGGLLEDRPLFLILSHLLFVALLEGVQVFVML